MQNTSNNEATEVAQSTTSKTKTNTSRNRGRGNRNKSKPANVITNAKFDVEAGTVYQSKQTFVPGEGTFSQRSLEVECELDHEYKYILNQAFKLAAVLNQKGTTQDQVEKQVEKLANLIEVSRRQLLHMGAKESESILAKEALARAESTKVDQDSPSPKAD